MKNLAVVCLCLALLVACSNQANTQSQQVDLLIHSGTVFDGTDSPAKQIDIAICGEIICGLSASGEQHYQASQQIDATGLIVSPGFIDPHTHSYQELKSTDKHQNLNYLFQGVTTVINGNDGDGPVDISASLQKLNPNGIGTNTAFYVGHGSLRKQVMGKAKRHATVAEIEKMKALLDTAMQQGALGLSSGLYYVPGSFASKEEVVELAKVAAKYHGIYDTHLRDESTFNIGFLAALDEAIDIAKQANIHLHVAHIKALGVDVWGQSKAAIEKINQARRAGVSISADQYPWQASGTNVRSAVVPKWAMADSETAFLKRLDDPTLGQQIKTEIKENIRRRGGPDALLITASKNTELLGLTLEQLAQKLQKSAVDTVIYLVRNGRTRVASFNMNKDDIIAFMQQPWVVTSSDGTNGHPRKYASFPQKYQEFVVKSNTLSLQRFIYSSTGQTAGILGISDRGILKTGKQADIVVFAPKQFTAAADFKTWNRLSKGVQHLLVNGQQVITHGKYTGKRAGQFVKLKREAIKK
ncbi:amidohydrolase family protein [uncultured Paraglaciecola sp.]|uniref:N-acyl-D-amino-acid deacylase family protein n=1 Tax=uncultured Paraglaciecola sp. TaxID=1765024 RepID=UPI0026253FE1|nr:amidohydrolase family protein [uncultured Paraglaciecola sp.]